jgi:hypothetical protein
VHEYNDQGLPNKITSLIDNKDLIIKSPLLQGTVSNIINNRNRPSNVSTFLISPKNSNPGSLYDQEARDLWMWIHGVAYKDDNQELSKNNSEEIIEEYRPLIFF